MPLGQQKAVFLIRSALCAIMRIHYGIFLSTRCTGWALNCMQLLRW